MPLPFFSSAAAKTQCSYTETWWCFMFHTNTNNIWQHTGITHWYNMRWVHCSVTHMHRNTHCQWNTHVPVLFKEVQLHVMLNIICLSIFINLCFYIKGKRDELWQGPPTPLMAPANRCSCTVQQQPLVVAKSSWAAEPLIWLLISLFCLKRKIDIDCRQFQER